MALIYLWNTLVRPSSELIIILENLGETYLLCCIISCAVIYNSDSVFSKKMKDGQDEGGTGTSSNKRIVVVASQGVCVSTTS